MPRLESLKGCTYDSEAKLSRRSYRPAPCSRVRRCAWTQPVADYAYLEASSPPLRVCNLVRNACSGGLSAHQMGDMVIK